MGDEAGVGLDSLAGDHVVIGAGMRTGGWVRFSFVG